MKIHFLTELSFSGLWLWIVDKKNRIFCARADNHEMVLLLAQEKGFEITKSEVVGGGDFYLIPSSKSLVSLGQHSGDFGDAPDEAREAIVNYFLAEGWLL